MTKNYGSVRMCTIVFLTSYCIALGAGSQPSGLFHGVQGAYTMHYHSETFTDMSGMSSADQSNGAQQRVITDAFLSFSCRAITDSSTEVTVDSARISYLVNDVSQSTLAERIQEELRSVFAYYTASDHTITRIASRRDCSSEAMQFICTLLLSLQCGDLAPAADSSFFINDRQGRIICTVLRTGRGEHLTTLVQKREYVNAALKNWRPGKALQQSDRIRGIQQSRYSATTHQLLWRASADTQTVSFSGKTIVSSVSRCTTSAQRLRVPGRAPARTTVFAQSMTVPEPESAEETRRAAKSALWSDSDPKVILDSLDLFSMLDSNAVLVLQRKLDAGMYLIKGFGDSLYRRSSSYSADDQRLLMLTDLYSQSSGGTAQQYFVGSLHQLRSSREFLSALTGFANIEHAEPVTLDQLLMYAFRDSSSAVRSTAVLALSAMIHELQYINSIQADSLMSLIDTHRSEMRPSLYLAVCGNAGLVYSLKHILALANNDTSALRLDALYALRYIQSPLVDTTLCTVVNQDDSLSTTVALRALSYRLPSALCVRSLFMQLGRPLPLRTKQRMLQVLHSWKQIDARCLDNELQNLDSANIAPELRPLVDELRND